MKLTIVIPALDEEEAIGATIERSLAARETIVRDSPIDAVQIVVVSDGSTDRTVEIASSYGDVRLIVFEKNRGYGAAIKRGFEEGGGELVGFLDADGTCDPNFFAPLCRALFEQNAAVAIGSRLGPDSRMPAVRRLGNRIYALILSVLSNRVVTDTASGMRVIRRDALRTLYPLPDGLNFTPAMSARVLMDDVLCIVERPMPYEERIGESKLHVLRDGVRFLRTIFEMALVWRPTKLFIGGAVACLITMVLFAMHPVETWLRLGHLPEDVIYRLLFCSLMGSVGTMLLSAGVVCEHLRRLLDERLEPKTFSWSLLDRLYSPTGVAAAAVMMIPVVFWLVGGGLWTWITVGFVDAHWSRVVLAGLLVSGLGQMLVTVLMVNLLRFHTARRTARHAVKAAKSARIAANTLPGSVPPIRRTAPTRAAFPAQD